nr:unnamed protein product [Digitaria exilis]
MARAHPVQAASGSARDVTTHAPRRAVALEGGAIPCRQSATRYDGGHGSAVTTTSQTRDGTDDATTTRSARLPAGRRHDRAVGDLRTGRVMASGCVDDDGFRWPSWAAAAVRLRTLRDLFLHAARVSSGTVPIRGPVDRLHLACHVAWDVPVEPETAATDKP